MLGHVAFEREIGDVTLSKTVYEPGMIMRAHRHAFPYVSFVVEGRYTEHRTDSPSHLRREMLVFHPAGETHADYVHDGTMATVNLEFRAGEMPGSFVCKQGPEVEALMRRFLSSVPESERSLHDAIKEVSGFLRACVVRSEPSSRMQRVREALDLETQRPVGVLAAELGIHRVRLHREYRRAYGTSPRADVTKRRIAVAAGLLIDSAASVAQVAAECGYYDQSHFCRQFKRATGLSPSGYRSVFAG